MSICEFLCFKQLPSTFTCNLLLMSFEVGAKLLLDAAGGLMLLSDNPLDLNAKIFTDWLTH